MTFDEVMQDDLQEAFFDPDLFSKPHMWNGKEICCVIDNASISQRYSEYFQMHPIGLQLVLVAAAEFDICPAIHDSIKFDNAFYSIQDIQNDDGMLVILLATGGFR